MELSTARTRLPAPSPMRTMVRASSRASSMAGRKAPEPYFTSSTTTPAPPASFLDMMLAAMSGSASTVPVTSRSA
jgi:hypothetical protein